MKQAFSYFDHFVQYLVQHWLALSVTAASSNLSSAINDGFDGVQRILW